MKKPLAVLTALCCLAVVPQSYCADAKAELDTLITKVKAELQSGKTSEADLAPDFKEFDALLTEHKGEKTDDVANILFMKAMLYAQVLQDDAKATADLKQLKADFPDTTQGKKVDMIVASLEKQSAANKIKNSLTVGSEFPDFHETDLAGQPLSISKYRGKLVLVDFWATWCGPCVAELPNVQTVYKEYHDQGLEVVGISLDQDKDKLTTFLKEKGIPWSQYFDGKGWESKLGTAYGISSIPATFLIGKDGKILGKDLRGEALGNAVKTQLAAK